VEGHAACPPRHAVVVTGVGVTSMRATRVDPHDSILRRILICGSPTGVAVTTPRSGLRSLPRACQVDRARGGVASSRSCTTSGSVSAATSRRASDGINTSTADCAYGCPRAPAHLINHRRVRGGGNAVRPPNFDPPPRHEWFHLSTSQRYELWQRSGTSAVLTTGELDDLLDARCSSCQSGREVAPGAKTWSIGGVCNRERLTGPDAARLEAA